MPASLRHPAAPWWRAFLEGAARVLDLGGGRSSAWRDRWTPSPASGDTDEAWARDADALASDWEAVAEDLAVACGTVPLTPASAAEEKEEEQGAGGAPPFVRARRSR